MIKTASMTGLAAWLAASGSSAAAQCVTVDPVHVSDVLVDPLNAAGAAQILQPLTLTFRRTGMDSDAIQVTYQILDEDTAGQRVGTTGGPQIEWRSGVSSRDIGASRNEPFTIVRSDEVSIGRNKSGAEVPVRLFVKNLGEDLPAGVYREQFAIRYWCGEATTASPMELPGVIAVTVQVPNVLSANVAGISSGGRVDFLDFANLSRSLSVSVRSTGSYSVTAQSVNSGAMVREGASTVTAADRLPYAVTFGGRPLAQGVDASLRNPRAGLGGQQIPLEIRVEDAASKRSGVFKDTLILTLAPAS